MIELQFKDIRGKKTRVIFHDDGDVITIFDQGIAHYSKESPIAAMYQRILTDARPVGENLFQVVGAW